MTAKPKPPKCSICKKEVDTPAGRLAAPYLYRLPAGELGPVTFHVET